MQRLPKLRVSLVREGSAEIYSRKFMRSDEVFSWANTELFADADREHFHVIILNSKNIMTGINHVSTGSLNGSIVHPREVLKAAILGNAAAMIFLHNHPSGDPAPSREDRECTDRLCKAAEVVGIRVLDHIICGETSYYSFADSGELQGGSKLCL